MPSIVILTGPSEGRYYPVDRAPIVFGRDEGCDIQIVDETVSGRHLRIRFDTDHGNHQAEDLRSTNGVLLNGRPHRLVIGVPESSTEQMNDAEASGWSDRFEHSRSLRIEFEAQIRVDPSMVVDRTSAGRLPPPWRMI